MKSFRLFFTLFFLFAGIHSFAQPSSDLKNSVDGFIKAMTAGTQNREVYISDLRPFIDPAAGVDSLVADYYRYWKANADMKRYPLTSNIKLLSYSKDTTTARVVIESLWHMDDGKEVLFISTTSWVKKNDLWYRTAEAAVMKKK